MMTQEEKDAINYRFSGYQLPMVQLDSTGAQYIQINRAMRQPYYVNQPSYWHKPFYSSDPNMTGAENRRAIHGRLYPPLTNNDTQ